MTSRACLAVALALVAGCDFDKEWQVSLRYPATLVLRNAATVTVEVDAVINSLEAERAFVLNGGKLAPGATTSYRISKHVYSDIAAGNFVLRGVCGENQAWEAAGRDLIREPLYNVEHWRVTVSISSCEP